MKKPNLGKTLIESAWDRGFTGVLGPRPKKYILHVEDNSVSFSILEPDDEQLVHLCWNCLLLDREFVGAIVQEAPEPHLQNLVCMTLEQKVNYLIDKLKNSAI